MSNIAILGHPTRGKEVIQLLEMLGADRLGYKDTFVGFYYYIECDVIVSSDECPIDAIVFTLEEFEEKSPYKVGDDVITKSNNVYKINDIMWDNKEIVYSLTDGNSITCWHNTAELQPYEEENIEGVYAYNEINCYHQDFGDKVRIRLGNDFEIKVEDNITYIVKKQSQYPKNYEECCGVLGYEPDEDEISCYQGHLIESFVKLLICRDAYWKIAGEQMGLGKPWEPDYTNIDKLKYCIINNGIHIELFDSYTPTNKILIFPTEEIRDAFYENFKDLIEQCKEVL